MSLTLLALLLFEALDTAHGWVYTQSVPTSPAQNRPDGIHGWTPKTTAPPRLRGQRNLFGAAEMNKLFKRSGSGSSDSGSTAASGSASFDPQTCGWYNADSGSPFTCDQGYACAYITSPTPRYWQCCATDDDGEIDWSSCPYYDTCYPYDSFVAPNTWTGSYAYAPDLTSSFYCPSNLPYCNTISLINVGTTTFQQLYCDTTESEWHMYQYTVDSSSAPASQSANPSSDVAPNSVPNQPTVSYVTVTKSAGGGGTAGASSSTSSSPTPTGGGSSTNVGAIAGGVVGGVAGLALIGAAVGYMIHRKKKERVEPMREISIYSQPSQPNY